MTKKLYEYEVEIKQVLHSIFIVEASDAKSAHEEAYEQFCFANAGEIDTDVIACVLMWSGEEPTEDEKARQDADGIWGTV